jgi:hypothetical protein
MWAVLLAVLATAVSAVPHLEPKQAQTGAKHQLRAPEPAPAGDAPPPLLSI